MKDLSLVIVGHVDHGKSTVIGRMLADTDSLPQGKLEMVQELCKRNAKPFEYAFLLDALKDERAQGITIDTARCFFKTKKRNYIILDAPGHVEFLKNMVSGASRAEAALLVIDALEGIQENSKRHAYLLSMLGITQIVVLINKMDLVKFKQEIFEKVQTEYKAFLKEIGINPIAIVPVSAFYGENIVSESQYMPWYQGKTVLELLDELEAEKNLVDLPFRMFVQDVYKFTELHDDRRIIAGTVETGKIKVGDRVIFYPSGKTSTVKTFEVFNKEKVQEAEAGQAIGLTLNEQLFIKRGELAALEGMQKPHVATRIQTNVFWLGNQPLIYGKKYKIKLGTSSLIGELESILNILDTTALQAVKKDLIESKDVSACIFKLHKPLAFDLNEQMPGTGRFVIVDDCEIAGGGIIINALIDENKWMREQILQREYKWEKSKISYLERACRYNQKAVCIFITGKQAFDKKNIAKTLERNLFEEGKFVYYLGMRNLLYGLDADIKKANIELDKNIEHLRRMAELVNMFLDAGTILIVTASNVTPEEFDLFAGIVGEEKIIKIIIGEEKINTAERVLCFQEEEPVVSVIAKIKNVLKNQGNIFNI